MELVEGENVSRMIQRSGVVGMFDWRRTLRLAIQVTRALEYAHGQNIIHRNIAPPSIVAGADARLGGGGRPVGHLQPGATRTVTRQRASW